MNLIGINQIKQEREEQITKHGRTVEYDVEHNGNRELSRFAGMLIIKEPFLNAGISDLLLEKLSPENWDMDIKVKMFRKSYTERLVIAGALIAAELDRLNYYAADLYIQEAVVKEAQYNKRDDFYKQLNMFEDKEKLF